MVLGYVLGGIVRTRIRWAVLGVCLLLGLLCLPAQAKPLVRLANGEWPPYLSETLPHFGFASDVVQKAFEAVGVEVEYEFFPWSRAFSYALQGRDEDGRVLHGTLVWVYTPARAVSFLYSDVVIEDSEVLFYSRDNPLDWSEMEDLRGKIIGGASGAAYLLLDDAEAAGILTIERSGGYESLFVRLLHGRVDAVPMVTQVGRFYVERVLNEEERKLIAWHPKVIQHRQYHLILSKNVDESKALMPLFNKGLAAIRKDGTYAGLLADLYAGKYDR